MKPLNFPAADLLLGQSLSESQYKGLFRAAFRGQMNPLDIKTFLVLLARKGEESPEINGCVAALRRLEPPRQVSCPLLIDVCGTGGDGSRTFNVSTVSAFVIAAAGCYVAKHGNRAVSSRAGSSDLMESLGVRIEIPVRRMLRALRECHLGFFHAPLYHPSFSRVQPIRRELGIRTLFNLVGPLLNPIRIRYQMIGVANPAWLLPVAKCLRRLGRRRAAVIRSLDGLDELSTGEANDILYISGKGIRKFRLDPRKLGLSRAKKWDYEGGGLKTNRQIALGILENRLRGPRQEIVLLNSGFALWLAGRASSVKQGVERSRWALRTGRAMDVLIHLRRLTQAKN